jgi:fructose/tagatose bisphosphate aldolase
VGLIFTNPPVNFFIPKYEIRKGFSMPLISAPDDVEAIYQEARQNRVVLANFCIAHPYAVEAALQASLEFGRQHEIANLPVIISVTGNYPIESQLISYTCLHDPLFGLPAFLDDIDNLTSKGSPYANLRVMLHLDHGQPDADQDLFPKILDRFATIMYDASGQPLAENIKRTAAFVAQHNHQVQIEGAVTEIVQAKSQAQRDQLTTPEEAEHFWRETGVSLLVCNLGSEHRATVPVAHYAGDVARSIKERVGQRLVLHGGSSLPDKILPALFGDGIIKVNLWTTFERAGALASVRNVIQQLGNMLSGEEITQLKEDGWLGEQFFSDHYRQEVCAGNLGPKSSVLLEERHKEVWQQAVVARMKVYLDALGYRNFGHSVFDKAD